MILTAKVDDRRVLEVVADGPVYPREVAAQVDCTYRTALNRLYDMESRGLVRAGTSIGGIGTSSGQLWQLTEAGRAALEGGAG